MSFLTERGEKSMLRCSELSDEVEAERLSDAIFMKIPDYRRGRRWQAFLDPGTAVSDPDASRAQEGE